MIEIIVFIFIHFFILYFELLLIKKDINDESYFYLFCSTWEVSIPNIDSYKSVITVQKILRHFSPNLLEILNTNHSILPVKWKWSVNSPEFF